MLRVILADDDPQFRRLLRYRIHWDALGLELVGESADGRTAVDLAGQTAADILITDIRMPDMDGLTAIRLLRERCPGCRSIIVSEHQDFGYAREAIRLGVSDYLLKPVDEEELNNALAELAGALMQKKKANNVQMRRKKLVSVLRGQRWLYSVEEANRDYGTCFSPTGLYMVLRLAVCRATGSSGATELAENVIWELKAALTPLCTDLESFMLSRLSYAMLLQVEPDNLDRFRRTVKDTYFSLTRRARRPEGERFYCSVGKSVADISQIRASAEGARFYINGRFTHGESDVFFEDTALKGEIWRQESRKLPYEAMHRLERAVEHVDEAGIRACIREAFSEYQVDDNPTLYVYLCRSICELLTRKLEQLGINAAHTRAISEDVDSRMENCDTFDMLRQTMENLCLECVRAFLAERQQNPKSYVQLAKSYIDAHYTENITLAVLAGQAHVNAAYLSALFKEELGLNYTEYLTSLRIEHAKTLLTDTSLSISDIAEKVGYNSTRYFSKLYENQTGIKPGEYRRLYLRHEKR